MTREHWDAGEQQAWNHYKRTGTIVPTYQGVIAEGIADGETQQAEERTEAVEESDSTEDRHRIRV